MAARARRACSSLPVIIVASRKFQRDSNAAYLDVRERIGHNLSTLQEGIAGVRVIQAYAREPEQTRRFVASQPERCTTPTCTRCGSRPGTSAVVEFCRRRRHRRWSIGVGGWLVAPRRRHVGTVAAFVLLLANLFEPVQQLSPAVQHGAVGRRRAQQAVRLLDTEPDVAERPGAVDLPATRRPRRRRRRRSPIAGTDAPVLRDVSLTVAAGERLALVGPTGAGKSTLAKLMARLYDPTDGTVTLRRRRPARRDARVAARAHRRRARRRASCSPARSRDNVRIAPRRRDRRRGRGTRSTRSACSSGSPRFPDGLDTEVRERGSRLSAGERQLVSLARAALADPAVLVLDEATSNLDPGTEAVVERALERADATAARWSSSPTGCRRRARADRIAVVDRRRARRARHPRRAGRATAAATPRWPRPGSARRWRRTDPAAALDESPTQPEARHHGRMIRHCVLFHFLPETTHDQIDGAAKLLLEYVATLDGVVSYRLGHDVGATDGNYDFAIVGDFETLDAYITYRDSPRHVEIAKGIVAPLLIERATVQFEID